MLYIEEDTLSESRSIERRSPRRATPLKEVSVSLNEEALVLLLSQLDSTISSNILNFHADMQTIYTNINHLYKQVLYIRKNIL